MRHYIFLTLTSIILFILAVFSSLIIQAQKTLDEDIANIKEIIKVYFDLRYLAHNTLQFEDFSSLVDRVQGNSFLHAETDKLEIELRPALANAFGLPEKDIRTAIFLNLDCLPSSERLPIGTITRGKFPQRKW